MNATILNVDVQHWPTMSEPCGHDTFEVFDTTDEARGGALNVQCSTCGQNSTITPINGKTITMTLRN